MSELEDIEQETRQLVEEMARIRDQLAQARTHRALTGTYADPSWYRRAEHALRMKGARHQQLLRDAARLRRSQSRMGRPLSDYFVEVAQEELEPSDFRDLWQMAMERKQLQDNPDAAQVS